MKEAVGQFDCSDEADRGEFQGTKWFSCRFTVLSSSEGNQEFEAFQLQFVQFIRDGLKWSSEGRNREYAALQDSHPDFWDVFHLLESVPPD